MSNIISQSYTQFEKLASSKLNTLINSINAHNHGSTGGASVELPDLSVTSGKIVDGAVTYSKLTAGNVVQVVNAELTAFTSCSTLIPFDDSVPVDNEGTLILTGSITPKVSTSKLFVSAIVNVGTADSADTVKVCTALFRGGTGDGSLAASACSYQIYSTGGAGEGFGVHNICVGKYFDSLATTAINFKVRVGPNYGTVYVNGFDGSRYYGGSVTSSITIYEILA